MPDDLTAEQASSPYATRTEYTLFLRTLLANWERYSHDDTDFRQRLTALAATVTEDQ